MVLKQGSRQAQCPVCDRIFTSDSMCEKHKTYTATRTICADPTTLGMTETPRGWTIQVPEDQKWWNGDKPVYVPAGPQTLTCANCNKTWERPAQRGRKPKLCADCNAASA